MGFFGHKSKGDSDTELNKQAAVPEGLTEADYYRAQAEAHRNAFRRTWKIFFLTGLITIGVCAVMAFMSAAWFVKNRQVVAQDAQIQVDTNSDLVISDTVDGIQNARILYNGSPFSVTFTVPDPLPTLVATTHDSDHGIYTDSEGNRIYTGLIYNTNPTKVSRTSGLRLSQAEGQELTFAAAPVFDAATAKVTTKRYYLDYTVYVAAARHSLTVDELNAAFSTTSDSLKDYQYASSVDFYLDSVSADNYKGTLNLAGINRDNSFNALTSVNLVGDSTTIPLNTEGYMTVIMRFYFDGALLKSEGQTYVYSNDLTLSNFSLKVKLDAVDTAD